MSPTSKMMIGAILISIPTIELGGMFLLSLLSGKYKGSALTSFQKAMFRAGHAHAGIIVILAIVCQLVADYGSLGEGLMWFGRTGVPVSALLISGGFFAAAAGEGREKPNKAIALIYIGAALLAAALIVLGISLLV